MANKFAIITGASSGIGLELAKLAAQDGYDLLLAADTPFTETPAGAQSPGRPTCVAASQTATVPLGRWPASRRPRSAASGR